MLGITPTERLRKLMERERYNEARAKVLEQARIIHTWASSHEGTFEGCPRYTCEEARRIGGERQAIRKGAI
jgi:hypothetical protein